MGSVEGLEMFTGISTGSLPSNPVAEVIAKATVGFGRLLLFVTALVASAAEADRVIETTISSKMVVRVFMIAPGIDIAL